KNANVQVYPIGVGKPGTRPKSVILVLDHSGSMSRLAKEGEKKTKIEGLHEAACEFIDQMRPGVKISILPFSDKIGAYRPFTEDKAELKRQIKELKPSGGTLLYDAIYAAIGSLAADPTAAESERVVVVMTDGVDEAPGSRHRLNEDVIKFAQQE